MRDNTDEHRFELEKDGFVAYADYRREGGKLVISYVFAPPEMRGTGAAGQLLAEIMAAAERDNLKIVPLCSYAASWMKRHPEYGSLLG